MKIANSSSAIAATSRRTSSEREKTSSPSALRSPDSEWDDLPVAVNGDNSERIQRGTGDEVAAESRADERLPVVRVLEELRDVLAILPVDESARGSAVVGRDLVETLLNSANITSCATRIFQREAPLVSGTEDNYVGVAAHGRPQHGRDSREVDVRGDHDVTGTLRGEHRAAAVRRGEQHGLALHSLRRELAGRVAEVEARDRQHLLLPGQKHVFAAQLLRLRDRFVGGEERHHGAGAV